KKSGESHFRSNPLGAQQTARSREVGLLTRQGKLPRAPELLRMLIRRTGDAACIDTRIYGFRKLGVFDYTDRLAGMVGKPFSLSSRLDATVEHPENHTSACLFHDVLKVEPSVKTMLEALHQRRNAATRVQPKTLHDAFGLDFGKMAPCFRIHIYSHIHSIALFYSLKPDAVVSQPVLGIIDDYPDQFLFAQLVKKLYTFISGPFCA